MLLYSQFDTCRLYTAIICALVSPTKELISFTTRYSKERTGEAHLNGYIAGPNYARTKVICIISK